MYKCLTSGATKIQFNVFFCSLFPFVSAYLQWKYFNLFGQIYMCYMYIHSKIQMRTKKINLWIIHVPHALSTPTPHHITPFQFICILCISVLSQWFFSYARDFSFMEIIEFLFPGMIFQLCFWFIFQTNYKNKNYSQYFFGVFFFHLFDHCCESKAHNNEAFFMFQKEIQWYFVSIIFSSKNSFHWHFQFFSSTLWISIILI